MTHYWRILSTIVQEFWHTRIEGQREAWDALRAACDAMCGEDLGLANAILEVRIELWLCQASRLHLPFISMYVCVCGFRRLIMSIQAANIITPGGSLDLSYDERGNQYRVSPGGGRLLRRVMY